MELTRKSFQGVLNILRFNRHFYAVATAILLAVILFNKVFPNAIRNFLIAGALLVLFGMIFSLFVSFYIYDVSDLYRLKWLEDSGQGKILNIHAGFDETSTIIRNKFPGANLIVCDFYDAAKHTELSIKRARNIYPPDPRVISVRTDRLPFPDNTFDKSLSILSAHEIRSDIERVQFFLELSRITKPSGQVFITEHLRDLNNFLAYTIGFFHFYSRKCWFRTFKRSNLTVKQEFKTTPFVTTFVLERNGNTV